MPKLKFVIVQHAPNADVLMTPGRYGVLQPVNMDGFYSSKEDAQGVADFMAEMRPDLETLLLEVVHFAMAKS